MDQSSDNIVRVKKDYLKKKLIIVSGATASGKSSLGMRLASCCDGEIIGADSIQMYRGFNIGAAKPSLEDKKRVAHHMVDILDPSDPFDAGKYSKMSRAIIEDIFKRGKTPIVVGGSGLYIRALLGQQFNLDVSESDPEFKDKLSSIDTNDLYVLLVKLDELRAKKIHPNDRYRISRALEIMHLTGKKVSDLEKEAQDLSYKCPRCWIYLKPTREDLLSNIRSRTKKMLDEGLIGEVKSLLNSGVDPESKPMQSIGYKEVVQAILNNDLSGIEEKIVIATRQYAKRQTTWFNKVDYDIIISSSDELLVEE